MNMNMSYEDAIKRLEIIINTLDKGDASLEESMALFQEGMTLSAFCDTKLNQIEKQFIEIYENGKMVPYDKGETL